MPDVALTIPAGKVGSNLTNFPVRVDMSHFDASFWATLNTGATDLRVKTSGGVNLPIDVVWTDNTARTGELFFRAPSIASATSTVFTFYTAGGAALPPTDPIGRNAVWADYEAMFAFGAGSPYINRKNGTAASVSGTVPGPNTWDARWLNLDDNGHLTLSQGVAKLTTWTLGASGRYQGNGATTLAWLLSYGSSTGASTERTGMGRASADWVSGWNSVDNWLSVADFWDPQVPYRFHYQHDGSNRRLYQDGVQRGTQAISTVRPGGNGNTLWIGAREDSIFDRWRGSINYVYLRSGALSANWVAAESLNWNTPANFYTTAVSGVPITVALGEAVQTSTAEPVTPVVNKNIELGEAVEFTSAPGVASYQPGARTFDQAQSARLGQRAPIESTVVRMFAGAQLPEVAWPGQLIWRTDSKILQVYNGTAYEDVAAGNAGSLTFVGPSVPVAQSAGDIWYKTDEGTANHPYRAAVAGADEIADGEWESVRDLHELDPARISPGELRKTITLGAVLQTASTGARVVTGPDGIQVFDTDGTAQTVLGSDGQSTFRGDAEVQGITVKGGASFRSTESEISRGGRITIQSGVTASATPPTVEVTWHNVLMNVWGGGGPYNGERPTGLSIAGGNYYVSTYSSPSSINRLLKFDANGVFTSEVWKLQGPQYRVTYLNATQVVACNPTDSSTYAITVWDVSNPGSPVQKYGGTINRLQTNFQPSIGRVSDTMFYVAERRASNNTLAYRSYDVAANGTNVTFNSSSYLGTNWTSVRIDGAYVGNADTGVARTYLNITEYADNPSNVAVRAYNHLTDNSGDSNYRFPHPNVEVCGLAWDGANFWTLGTDWYAYRHEGGNNTWTNTYSSSLTTTGWCSFTWEDTNVTGGTHETPMSAVKKFTMQRRASIKVTTPEINNTGDTNDPNAVGIYLARTTTTTPAPARTAMAYQLTSSTRTATVTNMSLTLTRIPPDPANNPKAFPTTVTPGEVVSAGQDGAGALISLKGNGAARIGNLSAAPATGALTFAAGPLRVLRAGSDNASVANANGDFTITHNLNRTDYLVLITPRSHANVRIYHVMEHNANNFVTRMFNQSNVAQAGGTANFSWFIIGDGTG